MPYHQGYSVLPKLSPLGDEPIFSQGPQYAWYLAEKKQATTHQQCLFEHDMTSGIYARVVDFIASQAAWVVPGNFESVALQLQEDIAVHRIRDRCDWLAACHICFPSGWYPEEKIGRPLREIHGPIPGMNLPASYQLATTMVNHGPFVRWVWSPVFEPTRINYHPRLPKAKFDPAAPLLALKLERQVTYGFPDLAAALFVMSQRILPPHQLDFPALYRAMSSMTPAEQAYKGVTPELLDWMRSNPAIQ